MQYRGFKYTLENPTYRGSYAKLYIWNELVQQFIFECSLTYDKSANEVIDRLIRDGHLRK